MSEPLPPLPEPVAWRYEDGRGHFRYRGFVPNFDTAYTILKPIALYTADQLRAAVAAERSRRQQRCAGRRHDGCNYLATCGSVCNKCGQVV